MRPTVIALTFAVASVGLARTAHAQSTPPALPAPLLLTPPAPDVRGPPAFAESGAPGLLLEPMRLSLSGQFMSESRHMPACQGRDGSTGGTFYRMLAPRLMLFGAAAPSDCPIDAVGTGGIAYAVPLGKRAWLVFSAGAVTLPPSRAGAAEGPPRVSPDVRATIVIPSADRKTGVSVGVGTRGFSLGGVF